jgi:hypothetical protein
LKFKKQHVWLYINVREKNMIGYQDGYINKTIMEMKSSEAVSNPGICLQSLNKDSRTMLATIGHVSW